MTSRQSSAEWTGSLKGGSGRMRVGSGAYDGPFTFASRFESGPGTNPEELIGAAHAGCYSMFLSALLDKAGTPPSSIKTTATVHLGEGPAINLIELDTVGDVPGITDAQFQEGLPGLEGARRLRDPPQGAAGGGLSAALAPLTRQTTSPTSSATSRPCPPGASATPTGRP
jgi:osmotically inducible protein OsmC